MTLFYPTKPAPLLTLPKDLNNWFIQPKLNGWHTLWIKTDNSLKVYTRNLKEITYWKGLQPYIEKFSNGIDPTTKIVSAQIPNGYYLAELLGPKKTNYDVRSIESGAKALPIFFDYITDLDDDAPYKKRYEKLSNIMHHSLVILNYSFNTIDFIKKDWLGIPVEGVVFKQKNSVYEASKHTTLITNSWLKYRY